MAQSYISACTSRAFYLCFEGKFYIHALSKVNDYLDCSEYECMLRHCCIILHEISENLPVQCKIDVLFVFGWCFAQWYFVLCFGADNFKWVSGV